MQRNVDQWTFAGRGDPGQDRIDQWTARCRVPMEIKSGNFIFKKCLCNYKNPSFSYYMQLYNSYKLGMLPFEGPVTDQPAAIAECFMLIERLSNERQEQEIAKSQSKGRSK